jgi:virginiamycin B lyase
MPDVTKGQGTGMQLCFSRIALQCETTRQCHPFLTPCCPAGRFLYHAEKATNFCAMHLQDVGRPVVPAIYRSYINAHNTGRPTCALWERMNELHRTRPEKGDSMKYMKLLTACTLVVSALYLTSVAVAASITVHIEEWELPTPDALPHDPAVAPDGSLWYTGMRSNTLGRLDPKTGAIKEYRLTTPDSGPHGLVADKGGNIWFTANAKGYIGKLDPQTGRITEYPMPDPAARDPHSLVFDRKGLLWFTVQQDNFVGRLDPHTSAIKLKRSPTPDSHPYGIAVSNEDTPFFCEFGTNKLAAVNPDTVEITEYLLPENARPRRLAIVGPAIYYSDFARGHIGRLDPKTRRVEEWPLPGGMASKPYGMAATPDGTVWYSESGVKPNTIVRFDPRQGGFASWPIPSGGGVVRNMVATPEGNLYVACSGVNKVGIVRVGK